VHSILLVCGGFLLAVLWMDLMFDVQVLRFHGTGDALPESVLASIAAYYRRVTTEAYPMNRAIGAVMVIALIALFAQLAVGNAPRWVGFASLMLCGGPVVLVPRIFKNAARLGARTDSATAQSALARGICRDHLVCLAGIVGFLALQLAAGSY
jgi:hypothetical protein